LVVGVEELLPLSSLLPVEEVLGMLEEDGGDAVQKPSVQKRYPLVHCASSVHGAPIEPGLTHICSTTFAPRLMVPHTCGSTHAGEQEAVALPAAAAVWPATDRGEDTLTASSANEHSTAQRTHR
jgi:hypothetical protein